MPQLDATSFPSQLFWLTISFVALYVVLARFLLPRVQSVLSLRAVTMESDIAQAEQLKSDAARAEEQYEQALAEARAKSQSMQMAAQADISARVAKRRAELDASIERKLAESEASVASAKQAVSQKLAPVAADLASLIVEAVVHQKPDAQAIGNAISEVARGKSL